MTAPWPSPADVADRVGERLNAYERDHRGQLPARWRVEIGPAFHNHLRKQDLRNVPGWEQAPDGNWMLWRIPVVQVGGPEGWRLMERP